MLPPLFFLTLFPVVVAVVVLCAVQSKADFDRILPNSSIKMYDNRNEYIFFAKPKESCDLSNEDRRTTIFVIYIMLCLN